MDFESKYETSFTNAEIAASATAYFFTTSNDVANKQKHGSFNALEVINDDDKTIYLDLDGLTTRRRIIFGKSVLVINPEERIYFNTIKITNTSGAVVVAADKIKGVARILHAVLTPVVAVR